MLLLCSTTSSQLTAQQLLRAEGQAIVNEAGEEVLLRGMGLGGWMLQEGYMLQTAEFANAQFQLKGLIEELVGEDRTQEFYDAWLENHVTEQDVIALKEWGFNSIRLPMHYNLYTLPTEDEPIEGEQTWLTKGFDLTDRLLEWCKKHELYLILDLHAAPGGQGYDQGISDYDTSKPSLWESTLNQDKTVALWRRLADRYKDEKWIGGYDLINEVNWNMNQNQPLRSLYGRITDAIREVDSNHIIFIEGNWFANDFTGLTPPWDDNMVYSPHKYWSINDQASIQWVLDLREQYDVPLYLGETGENSNVWFRDAIELYETQNMGWAWWPMKKIEAIAGPLSIEKTEGYSELLDYWKGNGPKPNEDDAFAALMDLTEKLKFDQCKFQPDVIDAMFRQQLTNETLPFADNNIPGVVYASDFDFGNEGDAYSDLETGTYHVSTGVYTAWNNGWQYRNDGVDIEICQDNVNANGYNVAWTDPGEWMKYTCNVIDAGIYDVHIRVAGTGSNGAIFLDVDGAKATEEFTVPNTGDFQNWQTMVIPGIVMGTGFTSFKCHIASGGFNISSYEFKYKGASNTLAFKINRATTLDQNTIQLQFNKPLDENAALNINDFVFEIDGEATPITDVRYSDDSRRIILVETSTTLRADQQLRITYDGDVVAATDNTLLTTFQRFFVENNLNPVLAIPGIIQAEDFAIAEGIQLEDCSDIGQGQNIGFLDPGDYLEYEVNVDVTGPYRIAYRIASQTANGSIRLSMLTPDGEVTVIDEPDFPITGGWQSWQTAETEVDIESGPYVMRIDILDAPFNMNWIEFESLLVEEPGELGIFLSPNPVANQLNLKANFSSPHELTYEIFDMSGQLIKYGAFPYADSIEDSFDMSVYPPGLYVVHVSLEDGTERQFKILKL